MVVSEELELDSAGRGCHELTAAIDRRVAASGVATGICSVFVRHTSASIMLCENADAEVLRDMERFMQRLVPDGDPLFRHTAEGADDMPAHVRSVLTHTDLTLPVRDGRLDLGTWQGIYLWEHRARPHRRRLTITVYGEPAD